jgi:hypothetical protein
MHLYLKYQSPNTFDSNNIAKLKFSKLSQKVRDQSQLRSKVWVPKEMSLHNASISQVSKL